MRTIRPFRNYESILGKLRDTIACGLTAGKGVPKPGQMCVEAAVCYVLGLPHGDNPESCVGAIDREFAIQLNDAPWSSDHARAEGLIDFAIAHLGSRTMTASQRRIWKDYISEQTIRRIVPIAFDAAAKEFEGEVREKLIAAGDRCRREGTAAAWAAWTAEVAARRASAATAAFATSAAAAVAASNIAGNRPLREMAKIAGRGIRGRERKKLNGIEETFERGCNRSFGTVCLSGRSKCGARAGIDLCLRNSSFWNIGFCEVCGRDGGSISRMGTTLLTTCDGSGIAQVRQGEKMKCIDVEMLRAACQFLDGAIQKQRLDEILVQLGASVSAVLHVADQRALRLLLQDVRDFSAVSAGEMTEMRIRLSTEELVLCAKFGAAWIDGFSAALRVFQMNREETTGIQEFKV